MEALQVQDRSVRLIWSRGNNRSVETTRHPQGPEGPEEGEA
jgi:hypothetical protein